MKNLLMILTFIILPINIYAHSLLLNVFDNDDGTITISGAFNTGESAQGALLKLESINTGEILFQKRLPDEGELTINIPKIAYQIVLDGGPGHKVVKQGIAPQDGFIKEEVKKEKKKRSKTDMQISSSKAVTYSIVLAFILLFATMFVSIRNTNKILKEIRA